MKAVPEDLIRRRAHEIWEQTGRPHGFEREHWLRAEKELLDAAPNIKAKGAAAPGAEAAVAVAVASDPSAEQRRSAPARKAGGRSRRRDVVVQPR
ncbi:MAG: DUF2934 domain-containing protein [Bauldia sp.]